MKTPKKKKGVPKEAVYNREDEQWELGKRGKNGKEIGEWKYWWPATGHLCGISLFERNGRRETRKRFHPDGTISHDGVLLDGQIAPGTWYVMQRSKNKTTELALQLPEYKAVFRMEEMYIRPGHSLWKNFNAKGQRINIEGELLLTAKDYAKNIPGYDVPRELIELIEFQNIHGAESYSECFALGADDKSGLAIWSKKKEFLSSLMFLGDANGTGSGYFFWRHGNPKKLTEMPIVIFGDEGGEHVVAPNLHELLEILAYDVEPMVTYEDVDFNKTPDHEPSTAAAYYRAWLKQTCGIAKPRKPDMIVRAAQKKYKRAFDDWKSKFFTSD